jgi:hypothetical protein
MMWSAFSLSDLPADRGKVAAATDPMGETVYIAQHRVAGVGNHTYLIIIPSDPASFSGTNRLVNGMVTVSGQPTEPMGGDLNSTINTDLSSDRNNMTEVAPPAGTSPADFDQAVYDAANAYHQDTYYYASVPEGDNVFNSNGFTTYVLNEAGVDGQKIVAGLPGWQPGSDHPPGDDSPAGVHGIRVVARALPAGYGYHPLTGAVSWGPPGIGDVAVRFEGGETVLLALVGDVLSMLNGDGGNSQMAHVMYP